jgi:hypothetical protein
MPNKKRSNRKSGLTKQNLLSIKHNIGKGISSGVKTLEEHSRPARKYLAEEYLKQGASMDDLMAYSGFLSDLKKFLSKCKINSKINDDIFYHSMNKLMKDYGDSEKYTNMIRNTFNSSLVHSTLPEEVSSYLVNTDKISNTKMDGLLQILYREMILDSNANIEPEHMIPDSGGIGFQAARESQKVRPVRSKINGLVSQIKKKEKALKVRGLTPSQKYTLRSDKKELINELSGIIGAPDTDKETLYALSEIKELNSAASKKKGRQTKRRKRR